MLREMTVMYYMKSPMVVYIWNNYAGGM